MGERKRRLCAFRLSQRTIGLLRDLVRIRGKTLTDSVEYSIDIAHARVEGSTIPGACQNTEVIPPSGEPVVSVPVLPVVVERETVPVSTAVLEGLFAPYSFLRGKKKPLPESTEL